MGRNKYIINSEGFLAEVFHPWVRWEGPGSGLKVRPAAQAAAAQSGNLGFFPLGIEVVKNDFRKAWLTTGQQFQGVGLKLTAFIRTFRDPSSNPISVKYFL